MIERVGTDAAAVRDRLALALDVDDLSDARALARRLAPWFGIAKVGFELYAGAGPAALEELRDQGFRVFADLKLHDIPTTVERAARVLARRGVAFLNFHAAGGVDMLRAAIAGCRAGAADAGTTEPITLAVTVLTSQPDAHDLATRLDIAAAAGCAGVVCAAPDLRLVRARVPQLQTMVPGIRGTGGGSHDHARIATPGAAIAAGADWLVIGRTVTGCVDPEASAAAVHEEVASALAARGRGT